VNRDQLRDGTSIALLDAATVSSLELPEPHTDEAAVRVIGSTLAISVLRTGSHVERAPAQDCYSRAIAA
jgi:hypothetical protein